MINPVDLTIFDYDTGHRRVANSEDLENIAKRLNDLAWASPRKTRKWLFVVAYLAGVGSWWVLERLF